MTGQRVATQEQHPWRAMFRTALAVVLALAGSWLVIVEAAGLDQSWEWVATSIAVAAAITRLMAVPLINGWLGMVGLGADKRAKSTTADPALTDEYHEATRYEPRTIHPDADGHFSLPVEVTGDSKPDL